MKHFLHLAFETSHTLSWFCWFLTARSFFLRFSADFCASTWCFDIGLCRNSVLGPLLFSVDIDSLSEAIPCHCSGYHWHTNASSCPLLWTSSLNFRLVYSTGYLIFLLGTLKFISFAKLNSIFSHQTHSYSRLPSLSSQQFHLSHCLKQ